MKELKIIYLPPGDLTPYEHNARKHAEEDLATIRASVEQFGFLDPIGIWGDKNIIVEGHGRQLVAIEKGMDKVPCIRLDELTDEQRRAYALAHNKTAEMSGWDFTELEAELVELEMDFDMSDFGFDGYFEQHNEESESDDKYSSKTMVPQYEPCDNPPDVSQLIDTSKLDAMLEEIRASNITKSEKRFLEIAAYRHAVIDFDKVADYYAATSPEMQVLMERSALVIVDIDNAIANGYVHLSQALDSIMARDVK